MGSPRPHRSICAASSGLGSPASRLAESVNEQLRQLRGTVGSAELPRGVWARPGCDHVAVLNHAEALVGTGEGLALACGILSAFECTSLGQNAHPAVLPSYWYSGIL